ncbi:MAG TPA: hypothetical protein VKA17_04375 [Gammaproteobacteria bacterium]|nr:hypothetical protein [Gammaproteobacteria bacterium]
MSTIRFHIGAHKTASTHLQMTLLGARLREGTRYVPLKRLRRTLVSPVRKRRPRLPWHRWYGGTWLFSDENVLGTTQDALRMYPEPARALRYFLDCGLSLFFCVRRYDTFLASAYGESLWRRRARPFPPELPQRRWPDVVSELQRDLPGVPVRLWCYEDYREHAQAVVQYYAGGAVEAFGAPPAEDPKSGFSARAVAEMAQFRARRPRKAEVLALRARYPIGPDSPRFDPWTAEQRARMREMYQEDLARLTDMAEFWRPGMTPSTG